MHDGRCGECGSPTPEPGPLTHEIARLHNELLRHIAAEQAARKVWTHMTDALNCRSYDGRLLPVGEKEIRRWRDALSKVME